MSLFPRALALLAVALHVLPVVVEAKQQQRLCAADPFADPRTDPCDSLKYIPSNALTAITFALFIAAGIAHVFNSWKWGAKWMAAMTVGIFTYAIGLATRFGLHSMPDSEGLYIAEYLLVPCAFIAAEYVLLGRLARHLSMDEYLLVSPRRVMPAFVASDVTTFLIQAVGGAVSIAANDIKVNKVGSNIFLAGLVLQLASFLLFTSIYLRFLYCVYTRQPETWTKDATLKKPWYNDWRALVGAMSLSCLGIIIRSVFRVVELSQGFQGAIATSEGDFNGFDCLPLFIAVVIYVPLWPGRFIRASPEDNNLPIEKAPSVAVPEGTPDLKGSALP
ncbi:hypothetical protein EW145_g4786 [Phellinidium pouzarii]|uniref:Uncharacterized protein n=1 Tax=Phellinidium pouzarii TaxID=167371 RepID=A0A4S4L451_9AGAM|nr:hypothetical protein EW145_g4786 [Phellinidium pouzarii]